MVLRNETQDEIMSFEKLLETEFDNQLFKLEYKGVRFWHLIRNWTYDGASNNKFNDSIKSRVMRGGFLRKSVVILYNTITHIKQSNKTRGGVDILVSKPQDNRIVGGVEKDIFIDFLDIEKNFTCEIYEYSQFAKATPKGIYSSGKVDLKVSIITLVHFVRRIFVWNCTKEEQLLMQNMGSMATLLLERKMEREFFLRLNYSVKVYAEYYKSAVSLLNRIKPKAVLLVNAYGIRNYAMCRAAKDLGVPTMELQHGLIGPWHIDYNYEDREDSFFYYPDYLFTFGEYWNDTCKTPEGCKKIAIGYAYQEAFIQSRKATASEDNTVVFYSNGTNEMAEFCKAFNDLAKHEYRVIFKYHPTECGVKEYMQLKNQGIEIIDRPEEVYNFIADYTHHVGSGTTVLFEALLMDRLTYVIDDVGYKYFENLIKKNIVEAVYTPHDLLRRMEALLLLNTQKESFDKEYFMEKNAVQNFRRTMDNILSSRMPDNHTN